MDAEMIADIVTRQSSFNSYLRQTAKELTVEDLLERALEEA